MASGVPKKPRRRINPPLEVIITLRPTDPAEQPNEEEIDGDAGDRMIDAVEAAGFEVIEWRTRASPGWGS